MSPVAHKTTRSTQWLADGIGIRAGLSFERADTFCIGFFIVIANQNNMTPLETKALEESAKTAQTFFGKILGPAADELGQQLADNMRLRRMRNQLKNLEKVRAIVEKEGVTMKQIDFKALFPLLEGTALEEDETLEQMWANLFTNYIDAEKNLSTHVYPDILRQLSSDEVRILNDMMSNHGNIIVLNRRALAGTPREPFAYLDQITNMVRLGIVEDVPKFKSSERNSSDGKIGPLGQNRRGVLNISKISSIHYTMTDFGLQFLEACSR